MVQKIKYRLSQDEEDDQQTVPYRLSEPQETIPYKLSEGPAPRQTPSPTIAFDPASVGSLDPTQTEQYRLPGVVGAGEIVQQPPVPPNKIEQFLQANKLLGQSEPTLDPRQLDELREFQSGDSMLADMTKEMVDDLFGVPERVLTLAKVAFENADSIAVPGALSARLAQLPEEEQRKVIGGAIDAAIALGTAGAGRALGSVGKSGGKKILKHLIRESGIGGLIADSDDPTSLKQRAEMAIIGGGLGAAGAGIASKIIRSPKGATQVEQATKKITDMLSVEQVSREFLPETANRLDDATATLDSIMSQLRAMPDRAKVMLGQVENVADTGTIQPKAIRERLTNLSGKIESGDIPINPEIIRDAKYNVVFEGRRLIAGLKKLAREGGDDTLRAQMRRVIKDYSVAEELFFKTRRQAGLSLKEFDKAIDGVKLLSRTARGYDDVDRAMPIFTEFLTTNKKPGDWMISAARLVPDYWRRNIFPVLSFVRDLATNMGVLASETVQDAAEDIYSLAARKPALRTKATLASIARLNPFSDRPPVSPVIKEKIDPTAYGERFRSFFGDTADKALFLPLKLKVKVDTTFKRIGATMELEQQAMREAISQGVPKSQRGQFIDTYMTNPPAEAVEAAMDRANRMSFNRPLSNLEDSISNNRAIQVIVTPFPRWNFQFTRFMLEHSPIDAAKTFAKVAQGKGTGEELVRSITRSLEGAGALKATDMLIYDNVDFNTMEYVQEDGRRMWLLGLTPIPELLTFNALLRGEYDKMLSALQESSVVMGPLAAGAEGIMWPMFEGIQTWRNSGSINQFQRELERFTKSMFPGQGMLRALERIVDPKSREGLMSDIPYLSQYNPERVSLITGEPMSNYITGIKLPGIEVDFGMEIPDIGTPGGLRSKTPLEQEIERLDINLRPRTKALLQFEANEVPPPLKRKFLKLWGQYNYQFWSKAINDPKYQNIPDPQNPEQQLAEPFKSQRQKEILEGLMDTAANTAAAQIEQGNGEYIQERIVRKEYEKWIASPNPMGPSFLPGTQDYQP